MSPRKDRAADKAFDAIVAELEPVDVTLPPPDDELDQDVQDPEAAADRDGVGPATVASLVELGKASDDLVRTARGAIEWARDQVQNGAAVFLGMCLMFVRMCFNVGPLYPDAKTAWLEADRKTRCTPAAAPRGRAGFFRGGEHWHVVLTLGNGRCISTDVKRKGRADVCLIAAIEDAWGYEFLGVTGDLNGEAPVPRTRPSKPRLTDRQWRIRHLRRAALRARSQGDTERLRRLRRWLDALRAR